MFQQGTDPFDRVVECSAVYVFGMERNAQKRPPTRRRLDAPHDESLAVIRYWIRSGEGQNGSLNRIPSNRTNLPKKRREAKALGSDGVQCRGTLLPSRRDKPFRAKPTLPEDAPASGQPPSSSKVETEPATRKRRPMTPAGTTSHTVEAAAPCTCAIAG